MEQTNSLNQTDITSKGTTIDADFDDSNEWTTCRNRETRINENQGKFIPSSFNKTRTINNL